LARTGIEADDVRYEESLYDSRPGTVLDLVNGIGEDVGTLLVVGHEPTTSSLAFALAGPDSDEDGVEKLRAKYPTSAMAVFTTQRPWPDLELGGATLVDFHVPR
jgi:phosphohistidine phosphatase